MRVVRWVQLEQKNSIFLNAIMRNREVWKHDKDFAKIVKKMEKGRNLRKKESDKIHWVLWEIGH